MDPGRPVPVTGARDNRLSPQAIFLAEVSKTLDSGKARRGLGWTPRPLEETVADAVNLFARQGAAEKR